MNMTTIYDSAHAILISKQLCRKDGIIQLCFGQNDDIVHPVAYCQEAVVDFDTESAYVLKVKA